MSRKDTVKLRFTGPIPCNTEYGKLNPDDTVDVERTEAEAHVKANPRLWNIKENKKKETKK